jgi:hypothetical protein
MFNLYLSQDLKICFNSRYPPKNKLLWIIMTLSPTLGCFNPFISITPSKPLMSSGSWLTLHFFDIYYLSAVNYDPVTSDLIFIRVSIYPGPGKGGLQLILKPIYFIRVTIYPATFPHNISRGPYLPRRMGGGCFLVIFQPIYFYHGHYLPCGPSPQY